MSYMKLSLLVLCLLATDAAAKRPGPLASRRLRRPLPEDLVPLPPGLTIVPPPERSAVEPVGPGISAEDVARVVEGPTDALQPVGAQATPPTATCGSYTETDIRPLRQQWDSGNGYCGEMSLQLIAMTRGIYISQKTSRQLGVAPGANHPDLLFDERIQPINGMSGVFGVAKMLGLDQPPESYWYSDNMTLSNSRTLTPPPSAFALWMKRNVMLGRPVIGGYRVSGGSYYDYDHIMPVYGVCYNSPTTLSSTDVLVLTSNYMAELKRSPSQSYFYAPEHGCGYTGCIPNDYYDYGVAVGPLKAPPGLYYPVKIVINSWSDKSPVNGEPGEFRATSATAAYTLTVSGLTPGQTYQMFRTTGLFAGFQLPQSAAALASTCAAQQAGCTSITFTAAGPTMTFTHESTGSRATQPLGRFFATGITYFLVVKV